MKISNRYFSHLFFSILFLLTLIILLAGQETGQAAPNLESPKWSYSLGGDDTLGSSPAIEDINGDGNLDIVFATRGGYITAVNHAGTLLWSRRLLDFYSGYTHVSVRASIAISDIDGDGDKEVIVPTVWDALTDRSVCFPGSIIVLDHTGNKAAGNWPKFMADEDIPPVNCPDGVLSTPAVADMDKDGFGEIVFGAEDKRIYALNHDGSTLPGFPIDSALLGRFPLWTSQLGGHLGDTIGSSPALADITGDGFLEIVIGTDEGNFGRQYGGDTMGWECPYAVPAGHADQYCGGTIYVITYQGNLVEGYPNYTWEIMRSDPALVDLNGDDRLDIVSGTGDYYEQRTSTTYSNRFFVYDNASTDIMSGWNEFSSLPEWGGGKSVDSPVLSSPAIGDITGDGSPDVVARSRNGTLYAWEADGSMISGFPTSPTDEFGAPSQGVQMEQNLILADYDGAAGQEIILPVRGALTVVNGQGQQLTLNGSNGLPGYQTGAWAVNTPAVADLDQDGTLEMISVTNQVRVWDMNSSSGLAEWPQYKHSADKLSTYISRQPRADLPETLSVFHELSSGQDYTVTFTVENRSAESISWRLSGLSGLGVSGASASQSSGSLPVSGSTTVTLTFPAAGLDSFSAGLRDLGDLTVEITGDSTAGSRSYTFEVSLLAADQLSNLYLPSVLR